MDSGRGTKTAVVEPSIMSFLNGPALSVLVTDITSSDPTISHPDCILGTSAFSRRSSTLALKNWLIRLNKCWNARELLIVKPLGRNCWSFFPVFSCCAHSAALQPQFANCTSNGLQSMPYGQIWYQHMYHHVVRIALAHLPAHQPSPTIQQKFQQSTTIQPKNQIKQSQQTKIMIVSNQKQRQNSIQTVTKPQQIRSINNQNNYAINLPTILLNNSHKSKSEQ